MHSLVFTESPHPFSSICSSLLPLHTVHAVVQTARKPRLHWWYVSLSDKESKKISRDLVQTNWPGSYLGWRHHKIVYRRSVGEVLSVLTSTLLFTHTHIHTHTHTHTHTQIHACITPS
uniref:Uncharacterized protein n=1 Tax=Myripristis murdjan TaxID=586833 RepID=A0A667YW68_9TELE